MPVSTCHTHRWCVHETTFCKANEAVASEEERTAKSVSWARKTTVVAYRQEQMGRRVRERQYHSKPQWMSISAERRAGIPRTIPPRHVATMQITAAILMTLGAVCTRMCRGKTNILSMGMFTTPPPRRAPIHLAPGGATLSKQAKQMPWNRAFTAARGPQERPDPQRHIPTAYADTAALAARGTGWLVLSCRASVPELACAPRIS